MAQCCQLPCAAWQVRDLRHQPASHAAGARKLSAGALLPDALQARVHGCCGLRCGMMGQQCLHTDLVSLTMLFNSSHKPRLLQADLLMLTLLALWPKAQHAGDTQGDN